MSDYGLKIALPGYDVREATPEQCAVHSSYPALKAKTNQTPPHIATVNVDFTAGVTQNVTLNIYKIAHGYNYIPFTVANIAFNDGAGTTAVGIGSTGVGATLDFEAYCDATYFYIDIYDNFNWITANSSLVVSYHIFAESGT